MSDENLGLIEESLDPEDWDGMRALGHRMVDDMLDYLQSIRERPPWKHAPDEVRAHFDCPLPNEPQDPDEIYKDFLENVLPYPVGNIHPRFWGWVFGTGTVFGAFAKFLVGVMNTNSGDLSYHSANYVEMQVLDWLKELTGFPAESSGLLTSGCSAANLIGLAVARNAKAGYDIRRDGVGSTSGKMTLYASQEIHNSVQKSVELLGLGSDSIRSIPVTADFKIDIGQLETAIHHDREGGNHPFCVVGGAGTTNTGAFDDLEVLAEICRGEDLWLHVDGAFGAWASLVPGKKHLVEGMEKADSLAFDLHKWMYMPYEIGCVLVQHEQVHRQTFSLTAAYLEHSESQRGLTGRDLPWLTDYGYQLSREFRALCAWMSLKEHGIKKYARLIEQNLDQAQYLGDLIQSSPRLDLAHPVVLNVVNFRYVNAVLDNEKLNELNKRILIELQERGIAVPSGTTIRGKFYLHVANTNHRSRRDDFSALVREVIRIGDEISAS